MNTLNYQTGFGNHFASEAKSGVLPKGQNSPQQVAYGLYAEQLSGTAFTAPRASNLRSWLYRIRPSVLHGEFTQIDPGLFTETTTHGSAQPPTQLRWDPLPYPSKPTDFLQGLITMASNGNVTQQIGAAIHHYAINNSMQNNYFYNADGEILIAPEAGDLLLATELGKLLIAPGEIAVIPRGIKFQVKLPGKTARGYVLENYGSALRLPELGPIGANGLANPRDFQAPTACYEHKTGDFTLFCKYQGHLWQAQLDHSPLDVVAWHGNYTPYKYNLAHFNVINTVSFDHPDPSIFTVLHSPSTTPGVANVDFVIFPSRWMVAEHTFRPPYYHRNVMSEYMGLIKGSYDAKPGGFVPGGASLHNCMSAHGPDADAYKKASTAKLKAEFYAETLAIMFESRYVWQPSIFALTTKLRQSNYLNCWDKLKITNKLK